MRKTFSILAAAAAVLSVSSCQLDKEQNYIFSYEAHFSLPVPSNATDAEKAKIEQDLKMLKEYMEENFIGSSHTGSAFGYYHDAYNEAIGFFKKGTDAMFKYDMDWLYSFITEDNGYEFVLYYILSGEKTREYIGGYLWNQQSKKDWEDLLKQEQEDKED